jgi:hypothetical protein
LFLAGLLVLIGAMLYAGQTLALPGGFSDITTSLTYLYWFAVMAFVIGVFLKSLFLLVDAAKGKKHDIKLTGNKRL